MLMRIKLPLIQHMSSYFQGERSRLSAGKLDGAVETGCQTTGSQLALGAGCGEMLHCHGLMLTPQEGAAHGNMNS